MHNTYVTGWVKFFYPSIKFQISLSGVQENIYLCRIYKNILQFQTIKDYHLFVIIAILLLMDCILLTAWSSTHSLYKESVSMTIKVRSINALCQFVAKRDHVANILYVANSVVHYSFSLQRKFLHDNKGELNQWSPPVCDYCDLVAIIVYVANSVVPNTSSLFISTIKVRNILVPMVKR